MQELFEKKLQEIIGERDDFARDLEAKETEISIVKRESLENMEKVKTEYETEIEKLKEENRLLVE